MESKKLTLGSKIFKIKRVDIHSTLELKDNNFPFVTPFYGYTYETVNVTSLALETRGGVQVIEVNKQHIFPLAATTIQKENDEWYDNESTVNDTVVALNKMEKSRAEDYILKLQEIVEGTYEPLVKAETHKSR